jgi:type II secretory pathway component PulF
MDRIFLVAPVIGELTRYFSQYRFSKLLGDFYQAGVSLPEAL